MGKRVAFAGHRTIIYQSERVRERLKKAIYEQINGGCRFFTMGHHGEFDFTSLDICRQARKIHPDIEIEVVLTSYHAINKNKDAEYLPYQDVSTVMFDIEDEYFKRQITLSNRKMIDGCDTLICYVDKKRSPSGAKRAMNYAKRKGLEIINVFREDDDPTFGMTDSEKEAYWNEKLALPWIQCYLM